MVPWLVRATYGHSLDIIQPERMYVNFGAPHIEIDQFVVVPWIHLHQDEVKVAQMNGHHCTNTKFGAEGA